MLWSASSSGFDKSTAVGALEKTLYKLGASTYLLGGDSIRHGLYSGPGFSDAGRKEGIHHVGEVANLMVGAGLVVLTVSILPHRAECRMVHERVGKGRLIEVLVDTPLAVCETRDPRSLYKKACAGKLRDFTGVDPAYGAPKSAEVRFSGEQLATNSARQLLDLLRQNDIIRS